MTSHRGTVPVAALALLCVLFIREVPLRTTMAHAREELAPEKVES